VRAWLMMMVVYGGCDAQYAHMSEATFTTTTAFHLRPPHTHTPGSHHTQASARSAA
jgi:hypothetical protein